MSRFTSMLKRLQPRRKSCRPNWVPSTLELLPPELILCINDFLERPDTLCLSLCSHHLREVLRRPRAPAGDTLLKTTMLSRIAPDLPHLFYCSICAKLQFTADIVHPSVYGPDLFSSKRPRIPKRSKRCPEVDARSRGLKYGPFPRLDVGGWLSSSYSFAHCHLMAAMKNHYHGQRYGPTAESLAYRKVRKLEKDPLFKTLLSVDARVWASGPGKNGAALVLQIQRWTLFASSIDDDKVVDDLRGTSICPHTRVCYNPEDGDTTKTTDGWGFGHGHDYMSEHLRCPICDVEYQLRLCDYGAVGKAFAVITWMDLGAGLDVNDPKWTRVTASNDPERPTPKGPKKASTMFQEASRLQQRGSDPTDLNLSFLLGNRYRRLLKSRRDNLYSSVPLPRPPSR